MKYVPILIFMKKTFTPFCTLIVAIFTMIIIMSCKRVPVKTETCNPIYFEIQSSNLSREMEFYKTVFGWNFVKDENTPIEYYQIVADGLMGGMLQRFVNIPPLECGTNAFVCSFQVDDFDETAERILQAGGQVAFPKFAIPGKCWQGYFIDTDNNTFGIYEMNENNDKWLMVNDK